MVLHLGRTCFVKKKSILMILDYKEAVKNQDTRLFLKKFKANIISDNDFPKAIVVTCEAENREMYLSPISPHTLHKRSGEKWFTEGVGER